jgi:hypothetical protein
MANTTSGTTTFEKGFSISDIIEEAYERIKRCKTFFKHNVSRMG